MAETRARPGLPDDGLTIHHVSDTHLGYRPWSYAEAAHMLADVRDGLITDVALQVHTGDIIDGADTPAEDPPAREWLDDVRKCAPQLVVPGNHDLRTRVPNTRSAWELAYARPGNSFVDVGGHRFVGFTVDSHEWNADWVVPEATWSWLDEVIAAAPGPVVLVDHYPPWELAVDDVNAVQPHARLAELVAAHPNVAGMLAGHMHWDIGDPRAARFVTLGGRDVPVLTDVSSMLTLPGGLSRDQSAQLQSYSAYVTLYPDRWEVRYRAHGTHAWSGPGGQRVTTLDLAAGTVTRGMS